MDLFGEIEAALTGPRAKVEANALKAAKAQPAGTPARLARLRDQRSHLLDGDPLPENPDRFDGTPDMFAASFKGTTDESLMTTHQESGSVGSTSEASSATQGCMTNSPDPTRSLDSTPPSEAQWPPSDLRIGLNLTAKSLTGVISEEDTDLMDSKPKDQWPTALWVKLGFNPPVDLLAAAKGEAEQSEN